MSSILALGFYCQIYKKKPNVRVFVNKIFIDEFDIEPHNFNNNDSIPNLKFYQLNLPEIKEHSVILEIKNNDSNYNNGFMTKSTLIKFHTCYIVPHNDYRYVLNKIYSKNNLKFEEPDMTCFNLIPHLHWKDERNNSLENISHLTIGGSGTLTCDLIKYLGVIKPKATFPEYLTWKIK